MSDEKKTSWGKPYDGGEAKHAAPPADRSVEAAPVSDNAPAPEAASSEAGAVELGSADGRPRTRNQHVLPGILGRQLRAAYGELLNAPVPDRISELINQLKNAPAGRPERADEEGSQ
jgi:hypothetical protein